MIQNFKASYHTIVVIIFVPQSLLRINLACTDSSVVQLQFMITTSQTAFLPLYWLILPGWKNPSDNFNIYKMYMYIYVYSLISQAHKFKCCTIAIGRNKISE